MQPIVIVNFKAYEQGYSDSAVKIAKVCAEKDAWVCLQPTDIFLVRSQTDAKILAQHVDAVSFGAHTGSILPEAVKKAGAFGTLINHSERRLDHNTIRATINRCKEAGLFTVLCTESVEEAKELLNAGADLLAVEIPELIGSDTSIVDARPGIVKEAVESLGHNVLLGAGVSSGSDLKQAMSEGAAGVILASAIVKKTDNPREALEELFSQI